MWQSNGPEFRDSRLGPQLWCHTLKTSRRHARSAGSLECSSYLGRECMQHCSNPRASDQATFFLTSDQAVWGGKRHDASAKALILYIRWDTTSIKKSFVYGAACYLFYKSVLINIGPWVYLNFYKQFSCVKYDQSSVHTRNYTDYYFAMKTRSKIDVSHILYWIMMFPQLPLICEGRDSTHLSRYHDYREICGF
jgi:hypothetical protein